MAEAVTGERYETLLAELVYRPLGLRDTSLPQGYRLPTLSARLRGGPAGRA